MSDTRYFDIKYHQSVYGTIMTDGISIDVQLYLNYDIDYLHWSNAVIADYLHVPHMTRVMFLG